VLRYAFSLRHGIPALLKPYANGGGGGLKFNAKKEKLSFNQKKRKLVFGSMKYY